MRHGCVAVAVFLGLAACSIPLPALPLLEDAGAVAIESVGDEDAGFPQVVVSDAGVSHLDAGAADAGSKLVLETTAIQTVAGPDGSGRFGSALALSGSADLLVVADVRNRPGQRLTGTVYVYRREGDRFGSVPVQTVSPPARSDIFGIAVALSNDGNTLAVASTENDNGVEHRLIFIYERSSAIFNPLPVQVLEQPGPWGGFALSLALSADGAILAVGDNQFGGGRLGAVHLFARQQSGYQALPLQTLTRPGGEYTGSTTFGQSVSFSLDGTMLVVGELNGPQLLGSVHVFQKNAGAFLALPNQSILAIVGSIDFGTSTQLSTNATALLVSDPYFGQTGGVHVFPREGNGFATAPGQTLSRAGGVGSFGASVAISNDQSIVVIGDQTFGPGNRGSFHLFRRVPDPQ